MFLSEPLGEGYPISKGKCRFDPCPYASAGVTQSAECLNILTVYVRFFPAVVQFGSTLLARAATSGNTGGDERFKSFQRVSKWQWCCLLRGCCFLAEKRKDRLPPRFLYLDAAMREVAVCRLVWPMAPALGAGKTLVQVQPHRRVLRVSKSSLSNK